jgi:hypothetical protein
MAKTTFEQDLISLVTSLIHLRFIGEELHKKPFAIPRMEAALHNSINAFQDLSVSFERVEETMQQDAQPYIAQWLAARRLQIGGGAAFEGRNGSNIARIRGRLSVAQLHPRMHAGKRYVELIPDDLSFSVDTNTQYELFETFTAQQLSAVLGNTTVRRLPVTKSETRFQFRTAPADADIDRYVARVLLPIKQADIKALALGIWHFRQV